VTPGFMVVEPVAPRVLFCLEISATRSVCAYASLRSALTA
jgi:hypothetical protein